MIGGYFLAAVGHGENGSVCTAAVPRATFRVQVGPLSRPAVANVEAESVDEREDVGGASSHQHRHIRNETDDSTLSRPGA